MDKTNEDKSKLKLIKMKNCPQQTQTLMWRRSMETCECWGMCSNGCMCVCVLASIFAHICIDRKSAIYTYICMCVCGKRVAPQISVHRCLLTKWVNRMRCLHACSTTALRTSVSADCASVKMCENWEIPHNGRSRIKHNKVNNSNNNKWYHQQHNNNNKKRKSVLTCEQRWELLASMVGNLCCTNNNNTHILVCATFTSDVAVV